MQAQNTFNEGMVLDNHPLMTPNTVLTDALNATLVTMNGNEMVLQKIWVMLKQKMLNYLQDIFLSE